MKTKNDIKREKREKAKRQFLLRLEQTGRTSSYILARKKGLAAYAERVNTTIINLPVGEGCWFDMRYILRSDVNEYMIGAHSLFKHNPDLVLTQKETLRMFVPVEVNCWGDYVYAR